MRTPAECIEQLPSLQLQLSATLSSAEEIAFLKLLWAVNALQTGRAEAASRFLESYPPEAATAGIPGQHAIYPWELETLANEFLTATRAVFRTFDTQKWNAIGNLVNQLRTIEDTEYGARRDNLNVRVELGRIGARQFPWQRGHVGIPPLYRNVYIYGQGECANYLKQVAHLSLSEMTLIGFALLSIFYSQPIIRPATDMALLHDWGISPEVLDLSLNLLSRPISDLRQDASSLRDIDMPTAYKPSILRQFPCVRVGHRNRSLVTPLPELIMDRVTNGLFYDVIGGGGAVRHEIGQRFEAYSFAILEKMLPHVQFSAESTYQTQHGPIATPDILMHDDRGAVELAIECKASRMSINARFGDAPEEDRGYEEIAKGVMQLWRFFAHCRLRVAPQQLAVDPQGLILTMDEWFAARATVIPKIFARANELADASAHEIPLLDRRHVAFCSISEMEAVLATATPSSILEAVRIGSGDRAGWLFSHLHDETKAEKSERKAYPFTNALCELLPWYARISELKSVR
jgi:hypothetical protein